MAIPRVVHQTAPSRQLSPFERSLLQRSRHRNPGWEFRLWDDADNRALFESHFPDRLDAYDGLPFGVMRADIARYAYMAAEGGFYIDTDYELLRPLDQFADFDLVLPVSREPGSADGFRLGNAILGSEPGNEFWVTLLDRAFADPRSKKCTVNDIEDTTGPDFLTRVYLERADGWGAHTPERHLFHPAGRPSRRAEPSYGIHYTQGSWRPRQAKQLAALSKRRLKFRLLGRF
jgi:mannosyltransferase OCH1-like enzyme